MEVARLPEEPEVNGDRRKTVSRRSLVPSGNASERDNPPRACARGLIIEDNRRNVALREEIGLRLRHAGTLYLEYVSLWPNLDGRLLGFSFSSSSTRTKAFTESHSTQTCTCTALFCPVFLYHNILGNTGELKQNLMVSTMQASSCNHDWTFQLH